MLECIKISNLALISKSVINFNSGFNVLTGETGAGKSLIVDALLFLTGLRADKTLIKSGEDFAKVEGVFSTDLYDEDLNEILKSVGIENEGTLIISRLFSNSLKNECRINGEIVTLNILRKVSYNLLDIFGQNDSQVLLNPDNHLLLLDGIFENSLYDSKNELKNKLNELKNINNEINSLGGLDNDRENNIDLLKYQINEIEGANLFDGLEEELKSKIDVMQNSEKIYSSLNLCEEMLNGENPITSIIKQTINELTSIENFDKQFCDDKDRLFSIKYELEDILSNIYSKKNSLNYSQDELDVLQDNLISIKDIERKYGNTISEVLEKKEMLVSKLDKLLNSEHKLEVLKNKKNLILNDILSICIRLHEIRVFEISKFREKMISELRLLGMKNANFDVIFTNQFSIENIEQVVEENGADKVEFMFTANLGFELKPLSKIISGGEMSRFMLAFKVLQNSGKNKTCIFDEIDTGIGGEIGVVVGKKISDISKKNQVICITHLPQIACFGDTNFNIKKEDFDGKTITSVTMLDFDKKVIEIARMLGSLNSVSIQHSKEIINDAIQYKNHIKNN